MRAVNVVVDINKGYEALMTAVVKQAITDYELGRKFESQRHFVGEVKKFFHSERFKMFSQIDGPTLFKKNRG